MNNTAERLDRALRAAGHVIIGVSIGDPADKATWAVHPPEAQDAAQPMIDAFNPDDPAILAAELTAMAFTESQRKDLVALCACAVRGRNVSAWTAMTTQQKVDATKAELNVFRGMREFIDDKV